MKTPFAQLKGNARERLLGNYGPIILAFLLTEIIAMILNAPFQQMMEEGTMVMNAPRILMAGLGMIIVSLVTVILGTGYNYMHLKLARGQRPRVSDLFYAFKNRPDRYIGYAIFLTFISLLCILPGTICLIFAMAAGTDLFSNPALLIAGIVLMILGCIILIILVLSWSLSIYLLLDDPTLSVMAAFKESSQLMKGNKFRLFALELSFLGWAILGLLSFMIGFLWISPYLNQTMIQFYLDLTSRSAA